MSEHSAIRLERTAAVREFSLALRIRKCRFVQPGCTNRSVPVCAPRVHNSWIEKNQAAVLLAISREFGNRSIGYGAEEAMTARGLPRLQPASFATAVWLPVAVSLTSGSNLLAAW